MMVVQRFDTAIAADFISRNRSHPTRDGRTNPNAVLARQRPGSFGDALGACGRNDDPGQAGMGLFETAEENGGPLRVEALEKAIKTGSSPDLYSIQTP
jgi:hypothetical protein